MPTAPVISIELQNKLRKIISPCYGEIDGDIDPFQLAELVEQHLCYRLQMWQQQYLCKMEME